MFDVTLRGLLLVFAGLLMAAIKLDQSAAATARATAP